VGIRAKKGVEAIAAFLGLMEAGFCPAFIEPVSPQISVDRMRHVGITVLLCDDPAYEEEIAKSGIRVRPLAQCWPEQISFGKTADIPPLTKDAPAMLLFTSGSTGQVKGVALSHGNVACNAAGVTEMTGLTNCDTLLHVMPLYHTNGINNQIIAPLRAGATVVLADRFQPECVLPWIEKYAITYMTGVPTHYSRLLPFLKAAGNVPRSLRFLRCGSAPITIDLHREIEETFGVELLVSYGLSEATCTTTMNPPGKRRLGSVGQVLRGQSVKLFRVDTEEESLCGEEGEICIGGGNLMLGYTDGREPSPVRNGFLHTGDIGRFDADGFLSVTGRLKNVIIRGGENLSPELIENILRSHAAVEDCCVVGIPSQELGEEAAAVVLLRDGYRVTPHELGVHVAARLRNSCVPVKWHFSTELPVNSIGKIDRKVVRLTLMSGLSN
jgi:acyl-CoA synthetase (AMP-forming)/AMP-acid ligase II